MPNDPPGELLVRAWARLRELRNVALSIFDLFYETGRLRLRQRRRLAAAVEARGRNTTR